MKQTTAIYPGTFDPITYGHVDLVRRAAKLFARIIVGVADNSLKKYFFSINERLTFARQTLSAHANVEVMSFSGLLVDFARHHNAEIILRGLRAVSDFEYEFQLAGMNRQLAASIESIFLLPDERYAFVSSSLVREIAALGGNMSAFVTPEVAAAIRQRAAETGCN